MLNRGWDDWLLETDWQMLGLGRTSHNNYREEVGSCGLLRRFGERHYLALSSF